MNFLVFAVFAVFAVTVAIAEDAEKDQRKREITHDSNSNYATDEGKIRHITLTKQIEIPHPVSVPVPVEDTIPYPVYIPVPVHVEKPYPVKVYKPYPVPVYKDVPVRVYKDIPIPVKVGVEVPYPVKVPVLVPQPYPIYYHETVTVPVVEKNYVERPVILEHDGSDDNDNIPINSGVSGIVGGAPTIEENVQINTDVAHDVTASANGGDYGNTNGQVQEIETGNGQGESDVHGSETNQAESYNNAEISNEDAATSEAVEEAKN